MRTSGNGGHRRPRQAPKFVVTVGATGAGIALPLLASAGTAHAATTSTWDRVAACETGGDWSSTVDGYAGGLGLTQPSWLQYGGADYAATPDLADRRQQITVAQRILDAQGPGYWGDCASEAGLTAGGPGPSGDSGSDSGSAGSAGSASASASASAGSAGSGSSGSAIAGLLGDPSATASRSPSASAPAAPAPGASAAPTGPPVSGGTGGAAPSGSGVANSSAPSAGSTDSTHSPVSSAAPAPAAPSSGRHARPSAAADGGASALGPLVGGAYPRPQPLDGFVFQAGTYTVQPGDDLVRIATKLSISGGWAALYDANRQTIGSDPRLIHPGQVLTLG